MEIMYFLTVFTSLFENNEKMIVHEIVWLEFVKLYVDSSDWAQRSKLKS